MADNTTNRYISENSGLITKALEYVKNNAVNSGISVADISEHAGFSIDYFNRIFLAHTGFTAMAYVNYIRTKKAAALLGYTDSTILDIALEVGYDSHEGFIKAFKKYYGMTPSDYRKQKKGKPFFAADIADKTVGARFVHDNPDFKLIESSSAIEYLFEKDIRRFGTICSSFIKYSGEQVAAPDGDMEKGFIMVGDDLQGGTYLNPVTDNVKQLAEWLKRFPNVPCFHSTLEHDDIKKQLAEYGVNFELNQIPQYLFFGERLPCELPEGLTIRPLGLGDREHIVEWAGDINGEHTKSWMRDPDITVSVLTEERIYNDDSFTVYGAFMGEKLIAVSETMAEEVMGYRQNDSVEILFGEGCEPTDELYKVIYSYITNDLLDRGILPLEDVQYGEYARTHGNFTAEDLGFTLVNRMYRPKR